MPELMHQLVFNIFSDKEEGIYHRFRDFRDKVFAPFCIFLARLGVKPDNLSYFSLFLAIPVVFFLASVPWISFLFLALSVIADMLDGCLARCQHHLSQRGSLLDIGCDHAVFLIVMFSFIFFQMTSPFWMSLYLVNYTILLFMVLTMRSLQLHVIPVIRSKFYIYLVFLIWLITGYNYFDPVLVFFSIYMIITNVFLFHKLRCSLS